jgi:putative hydrolase of the HAD superfamily
MPPFDVILFDVGGVLLTNGWDHRERAAAVEQFKLDAHELGTRHEEVAPAWER